MPDTVAVMCSDGEKFESLDSFWEKRGDGWLKVAEEYYLAQEATISGMLGGLEDVVSDDIARSDAFIKKLFALGVISSVSTALDGGAGIGRVTKHLLLKHAATVDMLEPSPRFIEASLKYVADERVRHRICATYSDFTPGADRYDIIWLQWSIGYIRDAEFVDVMRRLASSLTPGGAICIKDNVTSGDVFYLDAEDNCFIRPAAAVEAYMGEAGLKVGLGEREERPGLFPVGLWAFTKKE